MVAPIARGDRGPAVEDVQRRLLALGYDLGPTGVDGVFLGRTLAAVREFQAERGLSEDGVVGDETWAALVDATFRLGDRLLYLRFPYLHGGDVRTLQGALNVLGFWCGALDGVFGAFTERAVREFQRNVGLPADGIVGADTVGALERLRHVWQGKDPTVPYAPAAGPARAADALARVDVSLTWSDECGRDVAERVANLASAARPGATVRLVEPGSAASGLLVRIGCGSEAVSDGVPQIVLPEDTPAEGRFVAAFRAVPDCREVVVRVPPSAARDEHAAQASAVRILDGLCAVVG